MALCNKIIKPEFTKEQIAECQGCKHASGKKTWCCLFGVRIIEAGKIIVPDKRIRLPRNTTEYNKGRFQRNYIVAVDMAKGSGKSLVSETEFVNRRQTCVRCSPMDKQGCSCVGCKQWHRLVFVEVKCPKGKW